MLIAAIKSGNIAACRSMVVQFPKAACGRDTSDDATPAHWAAMFGHVELIELFLEHGAKLDEAVTSSGMQPIHWAATSGHTSVVKFLLEHGCDINAVDVKHTTPLVIAAQYDRSILVFFLVKEGADISLLDDCHDSALHWAAYKGNLQTAALLHYLGLPADAADSYGSTPLHLAAARNAPHVIEYLIDESTSSLEKLVTMKDNKDRTPLDIARERSHPLAVRLLQRANPSLRTRLVTMLTGSDGSKVMFYFYLINGALCYVLYALFLAPHVGSLLQHRLYLAGAVAMQFSYVCVHNADPGTIDMSAKGRKAYEDALLAAADGSFAETASMPPLCHTCRIVKPLRSKHCTTIKRCVPMFDHHCPYIGNTIGGGNYIHFVAFIFCGLVNVAQSWAAGVQFLLAYPKSPLSWFFCIDYGLVLLMAVMMNQYHLSLILRNLTTNEDMNKHRYTYLRDDLGKYRNPFSQGAWGNCAEFFRRRSQVLADPYWHSKKYAEVVRDEENDVELGEMDSENQRLTDTQLHPHGHSH